jgi:hypothetical protein
VPQEILGLIQQQILLQQAPALAYWQKVVLPPPEVLEVLAALLLQVMVLQKIQVGMVVLDSLGKEEVAAALVVLLE